MSRFHGPQGKGAMRRYRDQKREEAEQRQGLSNLVKTKSSKQKKSRQKKQKAKLSPEERLLENVFGKSSMVI